MTAKEKAKELTDNFRPYVDSEIAGEKDFIYSKEQETRLSMKCALITVDEILKNLNDTIPFFASNNELLGSPIYWNEVKTEIKNCK